MGRLTSQASAGKLVRMGAWGIRPLGLWILMGVLLAILLVQALPQVNLLDTAFQRNSAPVVVHSHATAAPVWATAGSTNDIISRQGLGCAWQGLPPVDHNRWDVIHVPDVTLRC